MKNATNAVSSRNPRNNLPAGMTPKQRSTAKIRAVLALMYGWHTTAKPLVKEVLNTTETTYLAQLEKKGLVKRVNAPSLLCGGVYMLTPEGVNAAATIRGEELPYSVHPASISHSLLKHNHAAQRIAIMIERGGNRVTPGRLLSAERGGKIPDALIHRHDTGETIALELELTGKWGDELEQTLNALLRAMAEGKWQRVLYASNSETLLKRYEERLKHPIDDWWQTVLADGSSRWIRGTSRIVSDAERAQFSWLHKPDLLKGFEQI